MCVSVCVCVCVCVGGWVGGWACMRVWGGGMCVCVCVCSGACLPALHWQEAAQVAFVGGSGSMREVGLALRSQSYLLAPAAAQVCLYRP
jgi:hypothetical protein